MILKQRQITDLVLTNTFGKTVCLNAADQADVLPIMRIFKELIDEKPSWKSEVVDICLDSISVYHGERRYTKVVKFRIGNPSDLNIDDFFRDLTEEQNLRYSRTDFVIQLAGKISYCKANGRPLYDIIGFYTNDRNETIITIAVRC